MYAVTLNLWLPVIKDKSVTVAGIAVEVTGLGILVTFHLKYPFFNPFSHSSKTPPKTPA